jgi:hypothetical protein
MSYRKKIIYSFCFGCNFPAVGDFFFEGGGGLTPKFFEPLYSRNPEKRIVTEYTILSDIAVEVLLRSVDL